MGGGREQGGGGVTGSKRRRRFSTLKHGRHAMILVSLRVTAAIKLGRRSQHARMCAGHRNVQTTENVQKRTQ